jgi:aminopeptidase-like protein
MGNQHELEMYFDRLWPICRSITGEGVRQTLHVLSEIHPIQVHEIPSGTQVLDWTIPREWSIRDAFIEKPDGTRIARFSVNNLHVVNYSMPIDEWVDYDVLKNHVHTVPHMPDAVPYITSYYKESWGFCMAQKEWDSLDRNARYRVYINSTLKEGSLTYGEIVLPGNSDEEVFFSTYVCHPSMANNELSGPLVAIFLARLLSQLPERRFTYRFVFIPETIGAIAYLSKHGSHLKEHVKAGLVVTCAGDKGAFHYKRSRSGSAEIDRIVEHVLAHESTNPVIYDFAPDGSDERQYCSPGFNLPVGSLMRTPYYRYKEYHTSLDNKDFISFEALDGSIRMYARVCELLEWNRRYINQFPFGEPQLGKRGLYPEVLPPGGSREYVDNLLYLLNFSDGTYDLVDIAKRRGVFALNLVPVIRACLEKGVLK